MLRDRFRLCLPLLLAASLLAACSDDPAEVNGPDPDPDPDPEFDIDLVVFRVYSLEAAGAEKLRWVGSANGPLPDSPEPTRWPWIGYARGFRIEWRAYSGDAPIAGTRYRVSQLNSGPWLPVNAQGATVWGDVREFRYENFLDAEDLPGGGCPEGPDCVGDLRFASGRHRLQVRAITTDGRELDEELGELRFEVNYPPSTSIVFDPAGGPEDPLASPVAYWTLADGTRRTVALAEGDTVPSGATLRFRARGRDRLRSTSDTDSFCCDERLDASGTGLEYQGNVGFVRESNRGIRDSLFTLVGDTSADSVFTLPLGPFDYEAALRSLDEHGRRGSAASLRIVAGYAPLRPDANVAHGSRILLSPTRDPGPGEGEFQRSTVINLKWDDAIQDWSQFTGDVSFDGRWYAIPLRLRGDPDPRVLEVSADPPDDAIPPSLAYSGHVRAFAYELVHELDPLNVLQNGPGDRDDLFLDADRLGELDLEHERTWRVFIPELFFTNPEFFDPSGACVGRYCGIGQRLRERLGALEFRVRSRTTGSGSVFHQASPLAARDLIIDLSRYGRFSPVLTREFSVRVAFTDENDAITGVWPPESP